MPRDPSLWPSDSRSRFPYSFLYKPKILLLPEGCDPRNRQTVAVGIDRKMP